MTFWVEEPWVVKTFLLGLIIVATIAIVKLARLASRLHRHSGEALLLERFITGEVEPNVLATYALGSRVPSQAALEKHIETYHSIDRPPVDEVLSKVRAAKLRFIYLCEGCSSQIESTKRSALLILALSFVMAAYGAGPTYFYMCNNSNLPQYSCFIRAGDQILTTLAVGLSLGVMVRFLSGLCERTLSVRRADWGFFFGAWMNDLSRK